MKSEDKHDEDMLYKTECIDLAQDFDAGIAQAAELIRKGELVAFPTETVYGLGADALRSEAVSMVYAAKGRPSDNPMIVHVASIEEAAELAVVTQDAEKLMEAYWPAPLTLVLKNRGKVSPLVTGGLSTLALRMPDHPAALALIRESGRPIAAPSANRSGRPSPTKASHVMEDMRGRIPLVLDGGDSIVGLESTVISLAGENIVLLRPGIVVPESIESVLGKPVTLAQSLLEPMAEGTAPLSPGMKYRHYAPQAEVTLVEGTEAALRQKTMELYDAADQEGRCVMILASSENAPFYERRNCAIMGSRDDIPSLCRHLYALLRKADEEGMDVVLIEAVPAEAMGLAFMNRALRAAGFHVTPADPANV